jgi:hypothetical protein
MLRGIVVTPNDVPLPRVRVAVASAAALELTRLGALPESAPGVLTDDRGQFTIQVPATTSIRLAFTKARYSRRTADISPRDLTVQRSEIRVRMSLAGAISGQVLDRSGTGVMMAVVTLQRVGAASTDALMMTMTNDLGEFRFGGLAEGAYAIGSQPPAFGSSLAQREANAAAVEWPNINVGLGAEVNVNLTIDLPSELNQETARRTDPDPDASASLSGRIASLDGAPIARAVVLVYRTSVPAREVETDARGRYRIDGLSAGEYTVEARKWGFENRRYGQGDMAVARSSGFDRRVAVKNGQAVDSIDVMLPRGGAIAGTIVDEFGDPMQDVAVSALLLRVTAGHPNWFRAETLGSSRTDDRGRYRLFGLLPGTYVVEANVGDTLSAANGYVPRFHPGTTSINQAVPTKVGFGAAATGIDLALMPTTAHTVTGMVLDSRGRPPVRAEVTLAVSERSGAIPTEPARINTRPDGSFAFTNVGPGDYVVQVAGDVLSPAGVAATTGQFAMSFVTVTANAPPLLQLKLSPGATLVGRVRYEGMPPPYVNLAALPVSRDLSPPLGDGWNSVSPEPDGTFEIQDVFGPTMLHELSGESQWYLKSVVINGQELIDLPFDAGTSGRLSDIEVVISGLGATARGRVTDDRAAPVRDYTAVVFSTFRDRWFPLSRWVKSDQSSADGVFTVTGLPPGDYWVAATDRLDDTADAMLDAELLESLSSRAVRITLGEGQSENLTLRLVRR